ncbi:MAG: TasA family protein [Acidimicrobiales bacterium]
MSMSIKKRLVIGAGALTTVAAAATLVAGVTFGLFSASAGPENNTFTSGTVSLSSDATGICNIINIVPGDSGSCTFKTTYTGSVPVYVGLTTATTGALWSGAGTDDAGANALVVTINSGTYAVNGTHLFVGAESSGAPQDTFTVNWSLPLGADNTYQNLSAQVSLTVSAVQSAHNGTGATCVVGSACAANATGILLWS